MMMLAINLIGVSDSFPVRNLKGLILYKVKFPSVLLLWSSSRVNIDTVEIAKCTVIEEMHSLYSEIEPLNGPPGPLSLCDVTKWFLWVICLNLPYIC